MPKRYIIGNWKMNQSLSEISEFFNSLRAPMLSDGNFWVASQALHLQKCIELGEQTPILVGAQNCSNHESGAYTGEISCEAIKDLGCHFALIGHSERRTYFYESDELVNSKVKKAMEHKLVPVICIGETLEQRQSGQTLEIVLGQLTKAFESVNLSDSSQAIVAYEPVWAIGTGITATSDQAEEVHKAIRSRLIELYPQLGEEISILYGGSVKPSNIAELLLMPNINGALVGGASLKASDFRSLCESSLL